MRLLAVIATLGLADPATGEEISCAVAPFPNFEAGPVNSLLRSADGQRLFVLNTPDHRVEVYRILPQVLAAGPGSVAPATMKGVDLVLEGAVFTGLEPVAMVLHPDDPATLFVSNHVSDSVSVVDLSRLQVRATLQAGDEPQGLAVSGGRLFVACARAPKSLPAPGQIDPGPLEDNVVAVFGAAAPYPWLGNVAVDALKPRDVTAVGGQVHVIPQNSGNHTTLLNENHTKALGLEQWVADAFDGGAFAMNPVLRMPQLSPFQYARGWYIPNAGRIVFDHEYPGLVPNLLDNDVITIDAAALAPSGAAVHGVGTTLLDVERNPFTGDLWIANTDARNRVRFEPKLRGDAVVNRVTIVRSGQVHKHIVLAPPALPGDLAQPAVLAFHEAGSTPLAYVAALQSAAVAVLDARRGTHVRTIATGLLPSGLAVDDARGILFVHCRGDHTVRGYAVNAAHREVLVRQLSYDPEPGFVRAGRRHLYEARPLQGHGNGRMACATCHVFGHNDQLAWDLGDPEGSLAYYYPDILQGIASYPGYIVVAPTAPAVHPMKGPMVTQSLRGLMSRDAKDDLTLHWRGERRTFHTFRNAFRSLLGGSGITAAAMQEFASFARSIRYAPNPFQRRDRTYAGAQALGADVYGMNPAFQGKPYKDPGGPACIDCHNGDFFAKDDFTGSRPVASAGSFTQVFQTAQMRMIYEKDFRDLAGFGALHDGAVDGIRGFMDFTIPQSSTPTFGLLSAADKDGISAFAHAWDHGLAPLVGAQFTLRQDNLSQAAAFLDLAEGQARPPASNVDLVLKGWRKDIDGTLLPRGAHYRQGPGGAWGYQFDTGDFVDRSVVLLIVQAGIAELTFTCVPPGLGQRLGIDRDEDGAFDFLEGQAGTDPARPDSDGDGYSDGFELAAGADPTQPDALLPDVQPPVLADVRVMEVFNETATLSFYSDEPARVRVELGSAPGLSDLGTAEVPGLRRTHEVPLAGLPARSAIHYRVTAWDRNGNPAALDGSFQTLPPFFHVAAVTLEKSGSGPFTLTGRIHVRDHLGQPVPDLPLSAFFSGDLGGLPYQVFGKTDASGQAVLTVGPFTPSAPTTVALSPAYLGSPFPTGFWFVGVGGGTSNLFYDQPANEAHYAAVTLP